MMKIGAEDKKKVGILAVLALGALYGIYSAFSGPSAPKSTAAPAPPDGTAAAVNVPSISGPAEPAAPRAPARSATRSEEFHPVLRSKRKEDQIDPFTIDPEIKLDKLARLQAVPAAGSGRNLFQFGAPPPVKAELPGPETIVRVGKFGPPLILTAASTADQGPPPPPPAAPFNAKYYGLATSATNGRKRAFFLDGEDIIIKAEGETVRGHFRVVRIGLTSVVVEDTDNKRQQTVQIAEDAQA